MTLSKPPPDYTQVFVIPGSPGRVQPRYYMHAAEPPPNAKKRKRRLFAFTKDSPPSYIAPHSKRLHLQYPTARIYSGNRSFQQMCAVSAKRLRLVASSGSHRDTDFIIFSAAFAWKNLRLWNTFLKFDPGPGTASDAQRRNIAKTQSKRINLWKRLDTDLGKVCIQKGHDKSTIVRAAAAWLIQQLDRLVSGKHPIDASARVFFYRFIDGRNLKDAQNLPNWEKIREQFCKDNPRTEFDDSSYEDVMVGEFITLWETEVMPKWQKTRMKILVWPSS